MLTSSVIVCPGLTSLVRSYPETLWILSPLEKTKSTLFLSHFFEPVFFTFHVASKLVRGLKVTPYGYTETISQAYPLELPPLPGMVGGTIGVGVFSKKITVVVGVGVAVSVLRGVGVKVAVGVDVGNAATV